MKQTVIVWGVREYKELYRNPTKGGEQVMRKGFTLIELLIVIAILGILVALILPRFSDIREDANTKVCVANLRGLASAMATYETRYNSSSISWDTMDTTDLKDLGYISTAVACPVGNVAYALVEGATGNADYATCGNVAVTGCEGHKWP